MSNSSDTKAVRLTRGQLLLTLVLLALLLAMVLWWNVPPEPMAQRAGGETPAHDVSVPSAVVYGSLEYRNPDDEVSHLVVQETANELMCQSMIEQYRDGVGISCPACTIGESSCSAGLPPDLQGLFENLPMSFPYLSAAQTRIAVSDAPMSRAISHCREMATVWEEGMGEEARCVTP